MAGGGFAFGAEVGEVVDVDADVATHGGGNEAFHADAFFCGELSAATLATSVNADVAECSAKVFGVSRVEGDNLVAAFPPEGGPIGDVAVIASECAV